MHTSIGNVTYGRSLALRNCRYYLRISGKCDAENCPLLYAFRLGRIESPGKYAAAAGMRSSLRLRLERQMGRRQVPMLDNMTLPLICDQGDSRWGYRPGHCSAHDVGYHMSCLESPLG